MDALLRFLTLTQAENELELLLSEMLRDQLIIIARDIKLA